MDPNNAIEVKNMKKKFKIYYDKGHMLKERLIFANRNKHEDRWVLNGVSFQIKKGEAVGLIGKNGCGKSTTLKLLNRIIYPNEGSVEINGKVSSLIELGAGFHEDMTGRENIYINASIFGLTRKEIDARLEDIIRFSELEEFIDNPVRTYSSGMYMRLAFSVAINVDADVLLIDEILAVGDVNFQEKCFQKLRDVKRNGTTIVIVSHALGQIEKICDRAIWIENGLIKEDGAPRAICKQYLESMEYDRLERAEQEYVMQKAAEEQRKQEEAERKEEEEKRKKREKEEERQKRKQEAERKARNASCREICAQCSPDAHREGTGSVKFTEVVVNDGQNPLRVGLNDMIYVKLKCASPDPDNKAQVSICISRSDWVYCFGTSTREWSGGYFHVEGEKEIEFSFVNKFLPGKYYLTLIIGDEQRQISDALYEIVEINVENPHSKEEGIVLLDYQWDMERNEE